MEERLVIHINIIHWDVNLAPYPFNEGHFPDIGTHNQLSLLVNDGLQVVIVAGGQCIHHCLFAFKQLHRESTGVKG